MPEQGADLAYFPDVDGTLLPIATSPDVALPDQDLCELLDQLSVASEGTLALGSGRSLRKLDRMFAPHRSAGASRLQALQAPFAGRFAALPKGSGADRHPDCKVPGAG